MQESLAFFRGVIFRWSCRRGNALRDNFTWIQVVPLGATDGAHSHPFFSDAEEYHRGLGCHGDQDPVTEQDLVIFNIQNQCFGSGDVAWTDLTGLPLYLRVSLGNQVKRMNPDGDVYPTVTNDPVCIVPDDD